jgi:ADP-ribose pyrophosphatase YjhB (NUDIX family)
VLGGRGLVLPVVQGLLEEGGRILLGERGERPYLGRWDLPGGVVGEREEIVAALVREYQEETGLEVRGAVLLGVFHYLGNGGSRAVFMLYRITGYGGAVSPSPELPRLQFFDASAVTQLDLTPWARHFLSRQRT